MVCVQKAPAQPVFDTRVTPKKGVKETGLPETRRLLKGIADLTGTRIIENHVLGALPEKTARRIRKALAELKETPEGNSLYQSSLTIAVFLYGLAKKSPLLRKRFRSKDKDAEDILSLAGLLHSFEVTTLQDFGLDSVAEIVSCHKQPKSTEQLLLFCAIRCSEEQNEAPALVILRMIQEGEYDLQTQLFLFCCILSLLDFKTGDLSPEESAAKNTARQFLLHKR